MKKLFTFFTLAIMGFVAAFAADEATETATATIIVNAGEQYEEEPIEGATVTFMGKEYVTPENGQVVVKDINVDDVLGKAVPFTAYKDGYDFYEGTVDFTEGFNGYAIATLTAAEATLTVKVVTGEDYDPIAEAMVTFQGVDYFTAENGEVTIKGISAPDVIGKEVPFTVYKDGYDFYEGNADFTETMEAYPTVTLTPAEASLTIKVTDADYEPIAGAMVTVDKKEYTTDETGTVVIKGFNGPDVIGTTIAVEVYADGYEPYTGEAEFDMLEAQKWVQLEAAMANLTIKVFADGEPLEGAFAMVDGVEYDEFRTNELGEVTINTIPFPSVMGKMVPVVVMKDGYDPYEGEANFTEGLDAFVTGELVAAEATLDIKVMAGDDPVEGAYITFEGKNYTTDANGSVKITGLFAPDFVGKTFPVEVYKDGYVPFEGKADFSETMEAYVVAELEADEATLTIKVFADEEPVEGAFVSFDGKDYLSDVTGEIKITGIDAPSVVGKTVPVTVYKDGYAPFEGEADFTEGIDAWVIAELVAEEATLTVKVMDGEDPVAGATVTFDGVEYTTDANGEVKITEISAPAVIGKTMPITVAKDGYETYEGEADFTETMDAYVVVELVNISTGINAIINDLNNADVKAYDLNGRRVINPANGQVYIINGQKVLLNR